MRCYRRFSPAKAISFDLDDTLYDNWPVIHKAEQAQLAFLHQAVPQSQNTTIEQWMETRRKLAIGNPALCHDLGKWRQEGIYHGLLRLEITDKEAFEISLAAFDAFYQQRIKVKINASVLKLLQQLAQDYTLIALSNGNASIEAMGLADVFEFAIHAGDKGIRQKPWPDMFAMTAKRLSINPNQILHVGDSLKSDVQGALNAGCSAVWFNPDDKPMGIKSALPHIEINELQALEHHMVK
jgi:HAD superfamily hydrolase (TIGR01549 family)